MHPRPRCPFSHFPPCPVARLARCAVDTPTARQTPRLRQATSLRSPLRLVDCCPAKVFTPVTTTLSCCWVQSPAPSGSTPVGFLSKQFDAGSWAVVTAVAACAGGVSGPHPSGVWQIVRVGRVEGHTCHLWPGGKGSQPLRSLGIQLPRLLFHLACRGRDAEGSIPSWCLGTSFPGFHWHLGPRRSQGSQVWLLDFFVGRA